MFNLAFRVFSPLSRLIVRYTGISVFLFVFMVGCSTVQTVSVPEPEPVTEPVPVKPIPPTAPVKPVIKDIAVLVTARAEVYEAVVTGLEADKAYRVEKYSMTGYDNRDAELLDKIQSSEVPQVVAVGLRAAKAAQQLQNKQVIFCQVFDYDSDLETTASMKGISALPSAAKLFYDWRQIDPDLRKVVVITGPGLDDYIEPARQAAEKYNIELIHKLVHTDKEYLYVTKKLPLDIQGYWILPDNRVLSRQVLQDVMTFNTKEGREIAVFSPNLLLFGGLISTEVKLDEVVGLIKTRLAESQDMEYIAGDNISLLDEHKVTVNLNVARQLGLTIPDYLMSSVYE